MMNMNGMIKKKGDKMAYIDRLTDRLFCPFCGKKAEGPLWQLKIAVCSNKYSLKQVMEYAKTTNESVEIIGDCSHCHREVRIEILPFCNSHKPIGIELSQITEKPKERLLPQRTPIIEMKEDERTMGHIS